MHFFSYGLVLTTFVSAQAITRPYKEFHLDMFETLTLISLYITMVGLVIMWLLQNTDPFARDQVMGGPMVEVLEFFITLILVSCVFFLVLDTSIQGMRAYKRVKEKEGKYGKGQQLVLKDLNEEEKALQGLSAKFMNDEMVEHFSAWLEEASDEEKSLFKAAFESLEEHYKNNPQLHMDFVSRFMRSRDTVTKPVMSAMKQGQEFTAKQWRERRKKGKTPEDTGVTSDPGLEPTPTPLGPTPGMLNVLREFDNGSDEEEEEE